MIRNLCKYWCDCCKVFTTANICVDYDPNSKRQETIVLLVSGGFVVADNQRSACTLSFSYSGYNFGNFFRISIIYCHCFSRMASFIQQKVWKFEFLCIQDVLSFLVDVKVGRSWINKLGSFCRSSKRYLINVNSITSKQLIRR